MAIFFLSTQYLLSAFSKEEFVCCAAGARVQCKCRRNDCQKADQFKLYGVRKLSSHSLLLQNSLVSKARVMAETWVLVFLCKPSQHFQTDSCQKKLYFFQYTRTREWYTYIARFRLRRQLAEASLLRKTEQIPSLSWMSPSICDMDFTLGVVNKLRLQDTLKWKWMAEN